MHQPPHGNGYGYGPPPSGYGPPGYQPQGWGPGPGYPPPKKGMGGGTIALDNWFRLK